MTPTIEHIEINPAEHAVRLTTTLNLLRKVGACENGYRKLLKYIGSDFDRNAPINLLTILESNGVEDCLWALCATAENSDVVARLMAADFAEAVLPIFERDYPNDSRPRAAISATRAFALGRIGAAARAAAWDATMDAAGSAAGSAAMAAAWSAAMAAAWAAARDAAWAAARDAARDAAWAAARDAAMAAARDAARDAQAIIIRRYLLLEAK